VIVDTFPVLAPAVKVTSVADNVKVLLVTVTVDVPVAVSKPASPL
jgi:hypothetical protein